MLNLNTKIRLMHATARAIVATLPLTRHPCVPYRRSEDAKPIFHGINHFLEQNNANYETVKCWNSLAFSFRLPETTR